MRKFFFIALAWCVSCAYAQVPKWASKARKGIISIITYNKDNKILHTGNGFFVKDNGTAVADYGLFVDAQRAVVIDADGKEHAVDCILGANSIYDVVKFRIKTDKKVEPLALATSPSATGSTVFLLPYASQKDGVPQRGTVDASTKVEGKYTYYTLHLKTGEKNMSCPVANTNGEIVGMIQKSADNKTPDNSYAVDAHFAADLSLTALSGMDYALNSIGIRKGLPENEEQAQVYLMMKASGAPETYSSLINDYVAQFPDSHEGYLRRATFRITQNKDKNQEQYKLADEDIKKAIEVSKRKDDAYYNASKLIFQTVASGISYPEWNMEKALQYIAEAIKLNPLPLYTQTEGDLYFAMKEYVKAYDCYDKVNHSNLRSAESLFSAARTKQLMGDNDNALALMDSTVRSFGDVLTIKAAPYLFQRGQMKAAMGKYREAVADYNEYEKLAPGNASAEFYYIREQAEMQCRLYQQALNDIEKAVGMQPQEVAFIVEQVSLYTRFNQLDKAVEAAQKGLKLDDKNPDLYRMLGFCQLQLKQKAEGKKNLEKAKELGDKNAEDIIKKYAK